jgi:hypothetical protein
MCLQAGQYKFSVTPPSTLPGITVLGSPLTATFKVGPPAASRSSATVTVPENPVIGSEIITHITLADAYGNTITHPAEGQDTNSKLVIQGE